MFNMFRFIDGFGGRKSAALWFGLIIPNFLVIGLSYYHQTEMGFDFARAFCFVTLGGLIAYITGNVLQKKGENNGK